MMTFEHGNAECSGSQLAVDVIPPKDEARGMVRIGIRPQSATGAGVRRHGFDAGCEVAVSLTPQNAAHVIAVLRGGRDAVMARRGVASCGGEESVLFLDAVTQPYEGFAAHIRELDADGAAIHGRFTLTKTEGIALEAALTSAMGRVAFG